MPTTGPVNRLLQQFEEAARRDLLAGRTSSESVDLAIEILRKAKIPVTLREEIRRVRERCTQAAAPATTAEPPGTEVGADT